MVNNNKILTVSYGTFSCTLEGFEDSFGTMKAIAEYFRDLAADDRYFGAEPPQPDADMLARIAEREITRQVRARQEPNRIVLRAADYQPPEAAEAVEDAVADQVEEPEDAVAAPPRSARRKAAPTPAAPAPAEAAAPDSIAAKLQRIRAVVSQNEMSRGAAFVEEMDTDVAFDEDALGADIGELTAALEIDDAAMEAEQAAEEIAASADISAALDMVEAPDDTEDYDEVYETPKADATAAMARTQEDFVLETDDAEEPVADTAGVVEDTEDSVIADEDDAARFDEDVEDLDDAEPEAELEPAGPSEDIQADEDDVDEAPLELAMSSMTPEDDDDDTAGEAPAGLFSDIEGMDADDSDEDQVVDIVTEEDDGAPRLLKVRRSELEAAIAAGELEEVGDDDQAKEPTLSADQEADLERELAKVLAETEAADRASANEERAARAFAEEKSKDDMSRIMADAEKRMEAPESSSNREAYSHLRAAVAVAKAEKSVGKDLDAETGDDAYRDDLASVVRPRRPVSGGAQRPERPAESNRTAPLKLVAEQRVDLSESKRGPVKPRRMTHEVEAEDNDSDDDKGFARFASEKGATDLPQLLEAAAAYLSFVEGIDQFSRPQLMRKLRQLDNHDFNREDGLRTFGQLLRDGKIEKTGGGRFTAAHDIGFRPDQRAAG